MLNDSKSEALVPQGDAEQSCRIRVWPHKKLDHANHGVLPSRHVVRENTYMKPVTSMNILDLTVAVRVRSAGQEVVAHRIQCAWKSWYASRDQLCAKSTPLRLRVQLLETVIGSTLLWGLETLSLTKKQRKGFTTHQRIFISKMTLLGRRATGTTKYFFRRIEKSSHCCDCEAWACEVGRPTKIHIDGFRRTQQPYAARRTPWGESTPMERPRVVAGVSTSAANKKQSASRPQTSQEGQRLQGGADDVEALQGSNPTHLLGQSEAGAGSGAARVAPGSTRGTRVEDRGSK